MKLTYATQIKLWLKNIMKDRNKRDVYDNLMHSYHKLGNFLKDALLDYQKLEWENATGEMNGCKKKYDQLYEDIQDVLKINTKKSWFKIILK
jgi:hypothetical protein